MAPHYSILAWEISWTEEPGGLQSRGSQSRTRRKQLSLQRPESWGKHDFRVAQGSQWCFPAGRLGVSRSVSCVCVCVWRGGGGGGQRHT